MKFNSQICTTQEQSERLLALGLKKETADMSISTKSFDTDNGIKYSLIPYSECKYRIMYNIIPAWSLHRLIEMIPKIMPYGDGFLSPKIYEFQFVFIDHLIELRKKTLLRFTEGNLYSNLISCIEFLIKESHFNKEYLEE